MNSHAPDTAAGDREPNRDIAAFAQRFRSWASAAIWNQHYLLCALREFEAFYGSHRPTEESPTPAAAPATRRSLIRTRDDAKQDPDTIVIYTSSDGEDGMLLAATLSAAGTARRYTTSMLTKWGIVGYEDDVHLLVTELITNAIKATGIPVPDPTYGQIYRYAKPISLSLYCHGDLLVIEVWDARRDAPKRHHPADDEEGGRGIMVIEGIAEAWGYRWPKTGGKVVWTSIKITPASQLDPSVCAIP